MKEWVIILLFEPRLLTMLFFGGSSINDSILTPKYLFLPFINLFSVLLRLLGFCLAGGLGLVTIPAGLYDLISKNRASNLYNSYINILDIKYILYL